MKNIQQDIKNKESKKIASTHYPFTLRGFGLLFYRFDKKLNQMVYDIGFSFKMISNTLRRLLHTGYWRQYALVIFFSIIFLLVLGLFMVR